MPPVWKSTSETKMTYDRKEDRFTMKQSSQREINVPWLTKLATLFTWVW